MFRDTLEKRIKMLSIFIIFLFILLTAFVIKAFMFQDEDNIKKLASQYEKTIQTYYPRGAILDRNGINFADNSANKKLNVSLQNNTSFNVGKTFIGNIRINEDTTTKDAVEGLSGLELYYNELLNGGTPINIISSIDATGSIINEENYTAVNDHLNEGNTVNTTVDYHLQKYTEEYLKKFLKENNFKGGSVVVTDVKTGEVLTMVSSDETLNKNVLSYQPGSVFKILTLAQALENNAVDLKEEFNCTGKIKIDGVTRYCHEGEGHGKITALEGLSKSCNEVFYRLAKRLNIKDDKGNIVSNKVIDYAKELGFGSSDDKTNKNKKFILEYDDYYSFVPDNIYNNLDTFNLALGQGKVQATPLMLNTIMSAIANGGIGYQPYIVESVKNTSDDIVDIKQNQIFDLKLKESTIKNLQKALRMVCVDGTAKSNSLDSYGGLAGKTGTAENHEKESPHAWFSGYFPYNNPKYAMTVFIENGGYGSGPALKVFDSIALEIMNIENDKGI